MSRLLARLGMLLLAAARVNRLEAKLGADPEHATTLAAVLYVFEDKESTPLLLSHMVKAYCQMRGVHVEIARADVPDAPEPPQQPGGIVH